MPNHSDLVNLGTEPENSQARPELSNALPSKPTFYIADTNLCIVAVPPNIFPEDACHAMVPASHIRRLIWFFTLAGGKAGRSSSSAARILEILPIAAGAMSNCSGGFGCLSPQSAEDLPLCMGWSRMGEAGWDPSFAWNSFKLRSGASNHAATCSVFAKPQPATHDFGATVFEALRWHPDEWQSHVRSLPLSWVEFSSCWFGVQAH